MVLQQTNFMESNSSLEDAMLVATQELSSILWNLMIHCHIHNSSPQVPILSQINPIHITITYLRSFILLYTYLRPNFPNGLFQSGVYTNNLRAFIWRMPSSQMLWRLALVRTDSVIRLLVTANVVHSSPILVTLMIEVLSSSETSVLRIATQRNNPEDGVLLSHRSENLKSSIYFNFHSCYIPCKSHYLWFCHSSCIVEE
jgi:hypothetical protein